MIAVCWQCSDDSDDGCSLEPLMDMLERSCLAYCERTQQVYLDREYKDTYLWENSIRGWTWEKESLADNTRQGQQSVGKLYYVWQAMENDRDIPDRVSCKRAETVLPRYQALWGWRGDHIGRGDYCECKPHYPPCCQCLPWDFGRTHLTHIPSWCAQEESTWVPSEWLEWLAFPWLQGGGAMCQQPSFAPQLCT